MKYRTNSSPCYVPGLQILVLNCPFCNKLDGSEQDIYTGGSEISLHDNLWLQPPQVRALQPDFESGEVEDVKAVAGADALDDIERFVWGYGDKGAVWIQIIGGP